MNVFLNRNLVIVGLIVALSAWVCEEVVAQQGSGRKKLMAIESAGVSSSPAKKKFEELLEQKDLSHFRGYQTEEIPSGWKIEGKNLVFDGSSEGDIVTKETYRDFDLQFEWMVERAGNSGVMFRVTLGDAQPYFSGPEFQILDDEGAGIDGADSNAAGALYDLYPAIDKKVNAAGKWNKSRIVVKENKITHYLNGVKVVDVESGSDDWNTRLAKSKFKDWEKFNQSGEGHIAFQNHGDPVKFRGIRVKRLDGENADAGDDEAGQVFNDPDDSNQAPGNQGDRNPEQPTPESGGVSGVPQSKGTLK